MNRICGENYMLEAQRLHLEAVANRKQNCSTNCLHDKCNECLGTGVKIDGRVCAHSISCPCHKCSPSM